MNNLTEIFKKGIAVSEGYDHLDILKKINKLENVFGDMDDGGGNWDLVWGKKGEQSIIYAFFSRFYPVALVKDECTKEVISLFQDNSILIAKFQEPFSCDEEVLKKYARCKNILDDRFLNDCDFTLEDDRLFYIYEGISYITPYSFSFDEIR